VRWLRERSLRRDFTLILLTLVIAPLALIGVWLARATARAGEELLRTRLEATVGRVATEVGSRWVRTRSDVLSVAERAEVQRAFRSEQPVAWNASDLPDGVRSLRLEDTTGTVRWSARRDGAAGDRAGAAAVVAVPIFAPGGARMGVARVSVSAAALLGPPAPAAAGVAVGVFDRASRAALAPLPFPEALVRTPRFTLGTETWLAARRPLAEPPLEVVATAPLGDYAAPFEQAARRGLLVLAVVAVLAFIAAAAVTRRTTRSLERLGRTAEAITRGELGLTVEAEGGEIGRLTGAFNAMSSSLRETMRELARRESLAAVGEFAASLSHEIRNPLASIRLDLQRVQEKLDHGSSLHTPLARALGEVDRLNRTVSAALRVARSGQVALDRVDLLRPLDAAVHAAGAELAQRGATLGVELPNEPAMFVEGNAAALEQLFLNLLLNAAQATSEGGRVTVTVRRDSAVIETVVRDTGVGIAPGDLARVFEPFFTTRPDGTGLGLAVVRGVAAAHRGEATIESTPGVGTAVRVRIPAVPPRAGGDSTGEWATPATTGATAAANPPAPVAGR